MKASNFLFFRAILIAAIYIFLVSWLLMWLWNITITRIFNIRPITYWEAFRLLIIASILFGTKISSI
ncbi:MAG: hypothetical protein GXX10_08290 [Clostridiaceae bacterium]|nr:hypothetical protein [Clostridiaceae bacterium]